MLKQPASVALFAVLHFVFASHSAAAEKGFYFSADAGRSSFKNDINLAIVFNGAPVPLDSSDLDSSDLAFEGLVGYRFLRYLAVEAAYIDLGELRYRASASNGTSDPLFLRLDLSARGYAGSVLGILPLSERWELFGRAGLMYADHEVRLGLSGGPGIDFADSDSQDFRYTLLGAGAVLNARDNWTVRLEYRYFLNEDDDSDDIDLLSLGVAYQLD